MFRIIDVMMIVVKQVMPFFMMMGRFVMSIFPGFMRMRHRRRDREDAGDDGRGDFGFQIHDDGSGKPRMTRVDRLCHADITPSEPIISSRRLVE